MPMRFFISRHENPRPSPLPYLATPRAGRAESALTFHAWFDSGMNADFSKGSKDCVIKKGKDLVPCVPNDDVKLVASGGNPAAAASRRRSRCAAVQRREHLGYNDKSWSATVSIWLRADAGPGLEPGVPRSRADHRR